MLERQGLYGPCLNVFCMEEGHEFQGGLESGALYVVSLNKMLKSYPQ